MDNGKQLVCGRSPTEALGDDRLFYSQVLRTAFLGDDRLFYSQGLRTAILGDDRLFLIFQ